ncbi:hypothetical protein ACFRAQ_03395 [Nocardia sp. NPDC056611]|uniref:hypothetical protein n=1 Tax=Nocardia sp. NPDC056611 TaxID=3345877 RepID=UPI00366DE9D3
MSQEHQDSDDSRCQHGHNVEIIAQISHPSLRRLTAAAEGLSDTALEQIISIVDIIRVIEGVHICICDI